MPLTTTSVQNARPAVTPLAETLLNIFAAPGDVFEEVVVSRPTSVYWLVPILIVCLTGILSLRLMPAGESDPARFGQLTASDASAGLEVSPPVPHATAVAIMTVAASAIGGTLWSTTILWWIGRVLLRTRFSFFKTLEVVALSEMILSLGAIVTALLGLATGDASARPALSLLAGQSDPGARARAALDAINFFHLWTTMVLAVGLSKLARVSFGEAAFWVFGYWFALRVVMICLT